MAKLGSYVPGPLKEFLVFLYHVWKRLRDRGIGWVFFRALQKARVLAFFSFLRDLFRRNRLSKDVLYAFYDLSVSPVTFDIIKFLILAERQREKLGYHGWHVVIVPGSHDGFRQGHSADDYSVQNKQWRVRNILVPCAWLIPNCVGVTVCLSRQEAQKIGDGTGQDIFPEEFSFLCPQERYCLGHIVEIVAQGEQLPSIRVPAYACDFVKQWMSAHAGGRKVVAITLRECSYELSRNSRLKDWADFARGLDSQNYFPVFIRDIEKAFGPIPEELKGFTILGEAVWNVEIRAAVYQLSYLNLFVNNGPRSLCAFNRQTRYVEFKATASVGSPEEAYLSSVGIKRGNSWPMATPVQKLVWEDDTFDVLQREFQSMCQKIESEANVE